MCDKTAFQQAPHCDIRENANNLLQAIMDHDPNLDIWDRENLRSTMDVLDRSMAHDAANNGTRVVVEAKTSKEVKAVIMPERL